MTQMYNQPYTPPPPPKKSGAGKIIAIILGAIVAFILVIIIAISAVVAAVAPNDLDTPPAPPVSSSAPATSSAPEPTPTPSEVESSEPVETPSAPQTTESANDTLVLEIGETAIVGDERSQHLAVTLEDYRAPTQGQPAGYLLNICWNFNEPATFSSEATFRVIGSDEKVYPVRAIENVEGGMPDVLNMKANSCVTGVMTSQTPEGVRPFALALTETSNLTVWRLG